MNSPSLRIQPFAAKDFKESSQHTFEFALIVTGILIFLIKLDWIPSGMELKSTYENDITSSIQQVWVFILFAIVYFIMVTAAVLMGRLYKLIFNFPFSRRETDILFTYLNNSLFILTIVVSFFIRCVVRTGTIEDLDTFAYGILIFFIVVFLFLIWRWCGRFATLNNIPPSKKGAFRIVVTLLSASITAVLSFFITSLLLGF